MPRTAPISRKTTKRGRTRQPVRVAKKRRIARARPMRALKTNYRAINEYRFMRETMPFTTAFTIIPAGPGFPAMGYLSFENLQFNQLPSYSDFQNLYARYKVDKIVTTLVPMFDLAPMVQPPVNVAASANLEITRVNTKWMNGDFPISANSDLQLAELAQLQAKTRTLYTSKKTLKLITKYPGCEGRSVVNAAGNEVDARRTSPWLALQGPHQAIDVPFKHNAILFASVVDGSGLTTNWKYRVHHQVYFRCAQVG